MLQEIITVEKFSHGGKDYLLNTPLEIKVTFEDGYWCYENEEYGLDMYSKNKEEGFLFLQEQFSSLCTTFLHKEDNKLTKGARILRDKLKNILKEIK